jgi:glycerophosphoryl diester phosphodiesterase
MNEPDRPLLVAHRAPRTAEGCAALAAAGASVFEIDVRVSGGQLVASHYFGVPGFGGRLQRDNWRLRWRSLARLDDPLSARIAVVPADTSVLLDLKERSPLGRARLVDALVQQLTEPAAMAVSSPDAEDLARLRQAGFRTWRSVDRGSTLRRVLAAGGIEDEALTVRHTLLDAGVIARVHELGAAVVAWTVNGVARAAELCAAGVDGVTTDRPAVLRALAR